MKIKNNRLAADENGFMVLGIIILAMIITLIVFLYFIPIVTVGMLICGGAVFLMFNGTVDPRYTGIMMVIGIVVVLLGVLNMAGVF